MMLRMKRREPARIVCHGEVVNTPLVHLVPECEEFSKDRVIVVPFWLRDM